MARLADSLPNLMEVRRSIDGDHDREKRVVNNWKCVDHWKEHDLEEVGVELGRGLKRFTHQRTPGVTDSEDIVRKWKDVSDDEKARPDEILIKRPTKIVAADLKVNDRHRNQGSSIKTRCVEIIPW